MTAETTLYLDLQHIYYNKAQKDTQTIINLIKEEGALTREDEEYVKLFVKSLP